MNIECLTICVAHNHRSYMDDGLVIFPKCVCALNEAICGLDIPVELVVCDFGGLGGWIYDVAEMPVRILECDLPFSVGMGRNIAAMQGRGNALYFCDTDMLTPTEVIQAGLAAVRSGKALFPLYKRYAGRNCKEWAWGSGHGNSIVSREHYYQSGMFPVRNTYGGEDTQFANWFEARNLMVREKFENYYHLWHPKNTAWHLTKQ